MNLIGKDCRNLIWKKLDDCEKFPLLFVCKKFRKEVSKFFILKYHHNCLNNKSCGHNFMEAKPCFSTILYSIIEKDYFDLLIFYFKLYKNDLLIHFILRFSSEEKKDKIFQHFAKYKIGIDGGVIDILLRNKDINNIKYILDNNSNFNYFNDYLESCKITTYLTGIPEPEINKEIRKIIRRKKDNSLYYFLIIVQILYFLLNFYFNS